MQRKPRFSGILLVAVLMVVVLLFVSLSPLVAASASKHVNYSDIYYYFQNQQVTSYRLDRNTNLLEMWLKEGQMPLPEDTSSTADLPSGGLLTSAAARTMTTSCPPTAEPSTSAISCPTAATSTPARSPSLWTPTMRPTPTPR